MVYEYQENVHLGKRNTVSRLRSLMHRYRKEKISKNSAAVSVYKIAKGAFSLMLSYMRHLYSSLWDSCAWFCYKKKAEVKKVLIKFWFKLNILYSVKQLWLCVYQYFLKLKGLICHLPNLIHLFNKRVSLSCRCLCCSSPPGCSRCPSL